MVYKLTDDALHSVTNAKFPPNPCKTSAIDSTESCFKIVSCSKMASKRKLSRREILANARNAKRRKCEDRQCTVSELSNRIRGRNNIKYSKPSPITHTIHEIDIPDYTHSYNHTSTYKSYGAFNNQQPVHNHTYQHQQINSEQHQHKHQLLKLYHLRYLI